ncbi:MAG: type II 3-dehydroquinate dehydratase [Spirochaetia bacterium]|nr:type II 3-dehydroquinate dehydratase [Spirochaetia bacterium]
MAVILLVNGPNLNLLGSRETDIYGKTTLPEIVKSLEAICQARKVELKTFQSNSEGALIDFLHTWNQKADYAIVNGASLTHTSVALRDALVAVQIPFVEVHLSNVFKREPFRHLSYLSDVALGVMSGFGAQVYELALQFLLKKIESK